MHLVCMAYMQTRVKAATVQLASREAQDTFVSLWMVVITFEERAIEPVCQHASHSTAVQLHALAKRPLANFKHQSCKYLLPEPETPPIT